MQAFDRVKRLVGDDGYNKLKNSSVLLFGLGGVGGYVAEALVRSGIGAITMVDNDTVSVTNINRQIIASRSTVGELKTTLVEQRLLDVNPNVKIKSLSLFVLPENLDDIDFNGYDYIIDAIDTVSAKIAIIERAKRQGVKIISCMGTGGKLDPLSLRVADLSKTQNCPLARVMRRELKKRGITDVKVVYSVEQSIANENSEATVESKGAQNRPAPASMIFVPATAGLVIASQVVKDLIGEL